MRASLLVLLVCSPLAGVTAAPEFVAPTGSAKERIHDLWMQTRPALLADASAPHSDSDWLARGAPHIASWTALRDSLAGSDEAGEAGAVLKLLGDVYGRAEARPERRSPLRQQALGELQQRLNSLESRLSR